MDLAPEPERSWAWYLSRALWVTLAKVQERRLEMSGDLNQRMDRARRILYRAALKHGERLYFGGSYLHQSTNHHMAAVPDGKNEDGTPKEKMEWKEPPGTQYTRLPNAKASKKLLGKPDFTRNVLENDEWRPENADERRRRRNRRKAQRAP